MQHVSHMCHTSITHVSHMCHTCVRVVEAVASQVAQVLVAFTLHAQMGASLCGAHAHVQLLAKAHLQQAAALFHAGMYFEALHFLSSFFSNLNQVCAEHALLPVATASLLSSSCTPAP